MHRMMIDIQVAERRGVKRGFENSARRGSGQGQASLDFYKASGHHRLVGAATP